MSVSAGGGLFRVRVSDEGHGIDAMQLPHATLMRGYSTRSSMGLGFTLMHEMSDRLCLATDPEGTTLIHVEATVAGAPPCVSNRLFLINMKDIESGRGQRSRHPGSK